MAQLPQTKWNLTRFVDTGRKKSYFAIIATLLLLIVLVLLIYPAIQHITRINKEISDARQVKASLEDKLENLEQARINLEEVEEDLAFLDLALPVGSDVIPYLQKIESFAENYDLSVEAVQFTNVPLSKPDLNQNVNTKQLTYNITFEGDFEDFKKLLSNLENYIRTSEVETVSSVKDEEEEEEKVFETLGVTTYYIGLERQETTTNNGAVNE